MIWWCFVNTDRRALCVRWRRHLYPRRDSWSPTDPESKSFYPRKICRATVCSGVKPILSGKKSRENISRHFSAGEWMFCHRNHARMSARIQKRSVGQTLVSHPPLGSQVGSIFRQAFSRLPQEVEPWGRNPTGLISNQLARNVVTLWSYGSPEGGMPSRSGFGVSGHPQITPLAPSNPHAGKKIERRMWKCVQKKQIVRLWLCFWRIWWIMLW